MTADPAPTERAHSELGASVAARFFACSGSVILGRGFPNRSSIHAERGTAAHALGEMCLRSGQDTVEYTDRVVEGITVDEEMADNVQVYVDVCRETMAAAEVYGIEQRFDLASLDPPVPMFGTADFWCRYRRDGRLVLRIVDYKNGWLPVTAEGNPQLRYYALGAMFLSPETMPDEIEAIIVQRDTVKRTTLDPLELVEWSITLMQKARETQKPDAPLAAGAWCRFCPVAGNCAEQARSALAVAGMEFSVLPESEPDRVPIGAPPDPRTLAPEELGPLLAATANLDLWINGLREAATASISRGDPVPGWKLVPTRPQAGWIDAKDAETMLSGVFEIDPHAPREVLSPAQARQRIVTARYNEAKAAGQKMAKKAIEVGVRADMEKLIAHKSSGLTLVPVSDTRIAAPDAGSEFGPTDSPEGDSE
jgi:hypothetical protein